MKKEVLILIVILLVANFISAACTVTLDKYQYYSGETATATMSCNLGNEKNQPYTIIWNNGTDILETDSGTTPSISSQSFFETLEIPFDQSNWTGANVTFHVDSVFKNVDTFIMNTTASLSSLIVKNITFTSASRLYIGKILGIRAIVEDEEGKKISNANCEFDIEDGTNLPLNSLPDISQDGITQTDFVLAIDAFDEGREYIARIGCFCGSSGTSNACIDEDGNEISNSVGSATNKFATLYWLTVNTVTSLPGTVDVGDEFSICANVTNNFTNDRVEIMVYYNWRCGSGSNSDRDRIVYGSYSQLRGISANTTQMQCHDFVVPNEESIEKGSTVCYAATDVSVINEEGESLVTYPTTSNQFDVNVYSVHPPTTFQRVSKNIYYANVSFNEFNVGVKNIHVALDGDLNGGDTSLTSIKNYTIFYFNGTAIPYDTRIFFHEHATRFQENLIRDDAIEIEIANVDTDLNETFNLTIEFENYEERQTEALEGINNKTGTFHLDVECPTTGTIGSELPCVITAYVEDSQTMQKEVDFTCYISDGVAEYSSTNFNQMVTRSAFTTTKNFLIPSSFNQEQQYVLQCHADYYNLGSRRDSFYDTFTTGTTFSSSGITGGAVSEEGETTEKGGSDKKNDEEKKDQEKTSILEKINPFSPERNWGLISAGSISLILLIILIILIAKFIRSKTSKHSTKEQQESLKKQISTLILAILGILIIIEIFYLGDIKIDLSDNMNYNPDYSILEDKLFRGIILTTFILLAIIVLSKALNIRGEVKFGAESIFKKYDKKMKEQRKLNKEMLKQELKNLKKKSKK